MEKTMATIKQLVPSVNDLLDEEALIKEARLLSRRRRRRRGVLVITLAAAVSLIALAVDRFSSAKATPSGNDASTSAATLTCPNARVKLLGVSALNGGLGHAGLLIRASVSSSVACTMSGYPTVGAGLSSHSTATATDVRNAYLGGVATKASAPLPRLTIASSPRVVSFTIQWTDGNGPTCPSVNAIQVTLPGSKKVQTARSMYEGGIGNTRFMGIYCSHLSVTLLVKGSSGNGS